MFRRTITSFVLAATAVFAAAVPVAASPTLPPPGPETLWVTAYYSTAAKTPTQLVEQRWHGCGQPAQSWGVVTPHATVFHPPCSEG